MKQGGDRPQPRPHPKMLTPQYHLPRPSPTPRSSPPSTVCPAPPRILSVPGFRSMSDFQLPASLYLSQTEAVSILQPAEL